MHLEFLNIQKPDAFKFSIDGEVVDVRAHVVKDWSHHISCLRSIGDLEDEYLLNRKLLFIIECSL